MSRYCYVTSTHRSITGVFLSKNKAHSYVKERNSDPLKPPIAYVDRLLRNEPDSHLNIRFTATQFLSNESYHGKDEVFVPHHLPFKEESY